MLPGVCQQLSTLSNSGKVSFKVLGKAAKSLQSYAEFAAKRVSNDINCISLAWFVHF